MKRIMIDASKCDGCLNCNIACMNAHRETADTVYDVDLQSPANETRNFILQDKNKNYKPLFCRHCDEPECAMSCMSGALEKDDTTGYVNYHKEKCGSCFMCVMNCPFGVLKPDTNNHYIVKCDFCQHKESPSCVEACPKGAITVKEV